MFKKVLCVLLFMFMSGCSSITNVLDTLETLNLINVEYINGQVETGKIDNSGVIVSINNNTTKTNKNGYYEITVLSLKTSSKIKTQSYDSYDLFFEKSGYETKIVEVPKKYNDLYYEVPTINLKQATNPINTITEFSEEDLIFIESWENKREIEINIKCRLLDHYGNVEKDNSGVLVSISFPVIGYDIFGKIYNENGILSHSGYYFNSSITTSLSKETTAYIQPHIVYPVKFEKQGYKTKILNYTGLEFMKKIDKGIFLEPN